MPDAHVRDGQTTRTAPFLDSKRVRERAKYLAHEDRLLKTELVRRRRDRGLTQQDVADLLGISQQAVQKLERYDSDPKMSTLARYANAVGALVSHQVEFDAGQSLAPTDSKVPAVRSSTTNIIELAPYLDRRKTISSGGWSELQSASTTVPRYK